MGKNRFIFISQFQLETIIPYWISFNGWLLANEKKAADSSVDLSFKAIVGCKYAQRMDRI